MTRIGILTLTIMATAPILFGLDEHVAEVGVRPTGTAPVFQDFWIYLYPREGRESKENRADCSSLEKIFNGNLAGFLKNTPYGGFRVRTFSGISDAEETIRLNTASFVECDPYVLAAAGQAGGNGDFGYKILLQRQIEEPLVAEFRVLESSSFERIEDLRDGWVGMLSGLDGCGRRSLATLEKNNLRSTFGLHVLNYRYVRNGFLCLDAGVVDAVVVPRDVSATISEMPATRSIGTTDSYLPPVFAAKADDLKSFPALVYAVRNEIQDYYGSDKVVTASDDLYSTISEKPSEPAPIGGL